MPILAIHCILFFFFAFVRCERNTIILSAAGLFCVEKKETELKGQKLPRLQKENARGDGKDGVGNRGEGKRQRQKDQKERKREKGKGREKKRESKQTKIR